MTTRESVATHVKAVGRLAADPDSNPLILPDHVVFQLTVNLWQNGLEHLDDLRALSATKNGHGYGTHST